MPDGTATAIAHPNIAFIKYWGNRDQQLRIPANGSISMTLGGLQTRTTVRFDSGLEQDQLTIDGKQADPQRASSMLDLVRTLAGIHDHALVESTSDFPAGAGLASSAAAFAALSLAASQAAGVQLTASELSALARKGSGSAARSVFGGFVELLAGETDAECIAQPIAGPDHWELIDWIAVANQEHKPIDSTAGHQRADTSPLQAARVADAPRRLNICRQAILERDFDGLAAIAELDSDLMHAVMMTSDPSLHYWLPATVATMQAVRELRQDGEQVFYTIDAGPNVHCICTPPAEARLRERLESLAGLLDLRRATPGGGARLASADPD